MSSVIPKGVKSIKDRVARVNPEDRTVTTESGKVIGYDRLVVSPGIHYNWEKISGLAKTWVREVSPRTVSTTWRR